MATTKQRTPATRQREHSLHRLNALLKREGLSLTDVRRILLPADPWTAVRGIWSDRRVKAERAQRKLRREWNRTQ